MRDLNRIEAKRHHYINSNFLMMAMITSVLRFLRLVVKDEKTDEGDVDDDDGAGEEHQSD